MTKLDLCLFVIKKLLRGNKQQIRTNPPREIAARRRHAPFGVGRVGAAVLGAVEANVKEGAAPGVIPTFKILNNVLCD